MLAMFVWFCLVLCLVLIAFRVALLQFDQSFFNNNIQFHTTPLIHSSSIRSSAKTLIRRNLEGSNSQKRLPLSSSLEIRPQLDKSTLDFSKKSSIATLDDLEKFVNSPLQVNPRQVERAFAAFLSVSSNDRKAFDYMIGVLSLFQSIKMNTQDIQQNPFILVLVPPRMNVEKSSVEKTLYFMEQIVNNLSEQDRQYFHFFIARYIDNPTNGKHSASNSVERRYMDTFNKIHMWRLDEFGYKKVIYLDADVVILRPEIDHLFKCGHFCAVSDLCVPDYFNGGLMVLKPDTKVFLDMKEKMGLKEYQSYDGGEQGFINKYFNFQKDSKFWPLEKLARESELANPVGGSIDLQESVKDDVYRLPFNYNGQVPLIFISKLGWNKKFGDKFVAVHITLPLKPWEFISFPIFDVSYYWYAYFRFTNVYRTFPWTLFTVNIMLVLSGFVILDRVLNSKRKLTSIYGMQWMVSSIEDRINKLSGMNDSRESMFTTMVLNFVPIFLIIPTTVIPVIIYMTQLFVQHYDPHMIWLNLIISVGAGAFIALGLFSLLVSSCTPSNISLMKSPSTIVDYEQLENRLGVSNGTGLNYCFWIMIFVSYMFLGFFSLFLLPSFLFGYISINIACTILYSTILLALVIFKVITPLANQVILHSIRGGDLSVKKSCEIDDRNEKQLLAQSSSA
ncbi:predicted protein [Naegleria gruberi]|uniref:Predicted protein n=1 Tax=Naegleria gruberi TaxID=5762 RepID=D2VSZ6_NAEGR|nr:uncharacterized protein NAEGRDRAFT_72117 [Naegleria gruberi]EFC39990.1 predicted protein [Naegleria gruberi]|eukprot:XP_002672734.1 predicted protein [Naegleria gruberi strain NEG-M]